MSSSRATTTSIHEVEGDIKKEFGAGSIVCLGDENATESVEVLPSGSVALDRALGVGGYPRGRIIEVFGPESSGKTTLAMHAIAEAHKLGGLAAFIDAEHSFDPRYAKALGIDLRRVLLSQPDCGEQGLDICERLISSGSVDLVVIDSVAALVPKAEIDADIGDPTVGLHARLMSRAMRTLSGTVKRTNTVLMLINQLRMKIGVMFGSPETTTGGQAIRFYASQRLDVRRIGKVTQGEDVIGNRTRVKVVKNKVAPPHALAEFDIRWGTGVDAAGDLLDTAVECGKIERSGAYYAFGGKSLGQGREKAREALAADGKLRDAIRAATFAVHSAALAPVIVAGEEETGPSPSNGQPSKRKAA